MELLTVLVIISMLMGFSAAAYYRMSRSFKEQAALAAVDVALRQARNSAVAANAPAFVEIDTAERRVVPWVYRTVGFWHFEDRDSYGKTRGAYHDGVMRGAVLYPDGKIGKCARLQENAWVDLGNHPDFDLEDGGYVVAQVRPACYTFTGDNFIFYKRNSYALKAAAGGVLVGEAGGKTVKSGTYKLVPGRWSKVAFAWDRHSLRLFVDDCLVGVAAGGRPKVTDSPLLIGADAGSFEGLVDEARVMAATSGNAVVLPPSYTVAHTVDPWSAVFFAPDGSLDQRYHAGAVSITLTQGTKARTVAISQLGQTTRLEVENVESKKEAPASSPGATAAAKNQPPAKSKVRLRTPEEEPARKAEDVKSEPKPAPKAPENAKEGEQ
jgi:hypothetical protein